MTVPLRTFYIDASVQIDVARALALIRPGIMYPGAPGCPIETPKTKDSRWLPIVGSEGWPVIMRDKRIRHRLVEKQSLLYAGVQAFCMTTAGSKNKWETMDILMSRWVQMEEIAESEPGPFIYAITKGSAPRRINL